jgi:hypothetical protein
MATDVTITQLPSGGSPTGDELFEIVQGGNSRKMDLDTIKNYVQTAVSNNITVTAEWIFDSSTAEGDPAATKFRLNNATQENSTYIYIDDFDKQNVDMGGLISRLKSGDIIYIQEKADSSRALIFTVNGDPEDQTGWWKIPVTNGDDSGLPLENKANCAFILYYSGTPQEIDVLQTKVYTSPLTGVVDSIFPMVGTIREVDNGQTGDVATDFPVSNQHAYIYVNSITTGGDIVITGTILSEGTAVPSAGVTETITVDTSTDQYYQTSRKWWEITNIDITSGTIVSINYDYGVVGYPDMGNRNFKLIGYRVDAYASLDTADFRIIIYKVQDDGSKKMSLVTIENMGVDSGSAGDQIIDGIRTGADDRTLNPAVGNIWLNNTNLVFKMLDFDTYFSSDENIFESATKDEGYIIRIEGAPTGGISGVDFISLELFYKITG